jgi:HEAT repeat protein
MKRILSCAALLTGISLLVAGGQSGSIDGLMDRLRDKKEADSAKAAKALEKRGAEAVPALVKALSESGPVAERAMSVLGRIGAPAVKGLSQTLASKNADARRLAATALKYIGPDAKDAVPALLEALKESKVKPGPERLQMIDALGEIGPAAKAAVSFLTDALKERDEYNAVPLHAAAALGKIGPAAKEAVPALIQALNSKEGKTGVLRIHVLEALGRMGPAASAAVPDLIRDIKKSKGAGRVLAVELLSQIGVTDKEKLAALEELMVDDDFTVRLHAVRVIGKTKPDHKTVVTVLVEGLQSKEAYQRKMAAETLEYVHPTDDAVLEALTEAARDRDAGVRQAAERALKKRKSKAP